MDMQRKLWFGGPVFGRIQECLGASLVELFKGEPFQKKTDSRVSLARGRGAPLFFGEGFWGGVLHTFCGEPSFCLARSAVPTFALF